MASLTSWIVGIALMIRGGTMPATPPTSWLAILLHDPATERRAVVIVSDERVITGRDVACDETTVSIHRRFPLAKQVTKSTTGYSHGPDAVREILLERLGTEVSLRRSVVALTGPGGVALFEGAQASGAQIHIQPHAAVIGSALPRRLVREIGHRLTAVEREPVAELLEIVDALAGMWPTGEDPSSAYLVALGPDEAKEVIAADRTGRLGRRLAERHLVHLARVEVPYQLKRARQRCPEQPEGCRTAAQAVIDAATRAAAGLANDTALDEAMAEAEDLLVGLNFE